MGFSKEGCLRSHRTTHSPLQPLKAKEISTDQDDQTMPMAMGMGLADWQLATFMGVREMVRFLWLTSVYTGYSRTMAI